MSGKKNSTSAEDKTPFWKRKSSSLPGSSVQQLKGLSGGSGARHKLSFKEFESHTNDAWDLTDDDLLRALDKVEINKVESNKEQVQATAQHVINEHSKRKNQQAGDNSPIKSTIAPDSNDVPLDHSQKSNDKDDDNGKPDMDGSCAPPSRFCGGSAPKSQCIRLPMSSPKTDREQYRLKKFKQLIEDEDIDLSDLKKLSWSGIPAEVRPLVWQLLSSYLPASKERREVVLKRKRSEYVNFVQQYFGSRYTTHQQTYQQIHIDIPRTNPLIPLFQQECVQQIFERLLFVWAVRHPASGYVQGINDLVTPFFIVYLSAHLNQEEREKIECFEVSGLEAQVRDEIEADTFWCLTNLLDGIQDNYTFAQPGVQRKVNMLRELTKRVDAELHRHMDEESVDYIQFALRWMNNLLMREIPLSCTIRLWDTYLSETDGFSDFHIYVCSAFLKHWRKQLLNEDFQGFMLTIQNVPTHHWGDEEIKLLLAEAFRLKFTFADAQSHLVDKR